MEKKTYEKPQMMAIEIQTGLFLETSKPRFGSRLMEEEEYE